MLTRRWLLTALLACTLPAQDPPPTFGTTVVSPSGFQGRIFHLDSDTERLPNLRRMRPLGTIYTTTLNVWPQPFEEGFPNITERFEWFAIEYTAKVWIETPGVYRFSLLSDDGSRLFLNDRKIIDNDGVHAPQAASSAVTLTRGVYDIKVEYFQGPRFTVALVLAIALPGAPWRIFNMDDFKPPKDTSEWVNGKLSRVQRQTGPN